MKTGILVPVSSPEGIGGDFTQVLVVHVRVQARMDAHGLLSNYYLRTSELCILDVPSA